MSEFDEKLGAILGDRNAMSQIMALAQSLAGPESDGEYSASDCEPELPEPGGRDQDVQLLSALRPYLKDSRRQRLDRAIELLQLLRLLKGNRE